MNDSLLAVGVLLATELELGGSEEVESAADDAGVDVAAGALVVIVLVELLDIVNLKESFLGCLYLAAMSVKDSHCGQNE